MALFCGEKVPIVRKVFSRMVMWEWDVVRLRCNCDYTGDLENEVVVAMVADVGVVGFS